MSESISSCENPKLQKELIAMYLRDQDVRKRAEAKLKEQGTPHQGRSGLGAEIRAINSQNIKRLQEIVDQHGLPTFSMVGREGAIAAWIIAQHADSNVPFQERMLALMEKAVTQNEARMEDVAYLTDRIRVNKGLPQVFGTQFWINPKTQTYEPRPIEDMAVVAGLRSAYGLSTFEEYVEKMKESYVSQ